MGNNKINATMDNKTAVAMTKMPLQHHNKAPVAATKNTPPW